MDVSKNLATTAQIEEMRITATEVKIAQFLQEQKQATYDEIIEKLGLKKSTVTSKISNLQKEGLIIKNKIKGKTSIKWVGGVPTLESDLQQANTSHMRASVLAESYDRLITDPFSPFSLLFENGCWEVLVNFKEGLTDTEIYKRIGSTTSLDSIRRALVICDTHKIIQIKKIRDPAGNDFVSLFEPLYKIEKLDRELVETLIIIRGLASATRFKMMGMTSEENSHLYKPFLDLVVTMFLGLKERALSNNNSDENELMKCLLNNYDYSIDLDRIFKQHNWRISLKNSENIVLDSKTDHVLVKRAFGDECKKSMVKKVK
ncbi:MAG: winged helix-turn-helix transcriptional regulator [Methanoregula sp.]|nr:winged helix-turn-helix transcriptional regulator [Methanoregula sp.]